jgi:phage-related protein
MEVTFYQTDSGNSPITKFIDSQPLRDQAAIIAILEGIEENGFAAKGAQFRQLSGKLWEIKIRAPSGGYRFLYVTLEKLSLLILHAFKKKTQKTPPKELKVAQKRLQEFL